MYPVHGRASYMLSPFQLVVNCLSSKSCADSLRACQSFRVLPMSSRGADSSSSRFQNPSAMQQFSGTAEATQDIIYRTHSIRGLHLHNPRRQAQRATAAQAPCCTRRAHVVYRMSYAYTSLMMFTFTLSRLTRFCLQYSLHMPCICCLHFCVLRKDSSWKKMAACKGATNDCRNRQPAASSLTTPLAVCSVLERQDPISRPEARCPDSSWHREDT